MLYLGNEFSRGESGGASEKQFFSIWMNRGKEKKKNLMKNISFGPQSDFERIFSLYSK